MSLEPWEKKFLATCLAIIVAGVLLFSYAWPRFASAYNECRKAGNAPDVCLTEPEARP